MDKNDRPTTVEYLLIIGMVMVGMSLLSRLSGAEIRDVVSSLTEDLVYLKFD